MRGRMSKRVVIDRDVLGWADEHRESLLERYESILQVSKHPDLPQRSFDQTIAAYCRRNDCDLITGDAKSYTHFFEAGIEEVIITRLEKWEKADKYIYLVKTSR
jgi:hypothetical protein